MNSISFGGYKDWRVPDIEELSSIRYCPQGFEDVISIPTKTGTTRLTGFYCRGKENPIQKPKIDVQIFPNTPIDFYWSLSLKMQNNKLVVWVVDINGGSAYYDYSQDNNFRVRVVRGDNSQ